MVPADHESPGQHMQRRLRESQDVATRNSREENSLANQLTSTAEHGHGARSWERHADVGLESFEARGHHVSGARRVAAPVPRTGEQAHGLQNNSVPSTRSSGKSTSDHTNRVWRRAKLRGDSKWPRAALGKESESRPNLREVEGHPAFSQTQISQAETAPVTMQLSDERQSRDEGLHG